MATRSAGKRASNYATVTPLHTKMELFKVTCHNMLSVFVLLKGYIFFFVDLLKSTVTEICALGSSSHVDLFSASAL